jgi:site-specific recombinase XerD
LQKAFKDVVRKSRIAKNASPHSLPHYFAAHLLQNGNDFRAVQQLPGHKEFNDNDLHARALK